MKKLIILALCASALSGCIRFKTPTHDVEVSIPPELYEAKASE